MYIYVDWILGWHNNQHISVQVGAIEPHRFTAAIGD